MNVPVTFLAPAFLALLVLVPILWFVPRRVRDWRHGALRSAAVLFLALGLARPAMVAEDTTSHCTLILDASGSAGSAGLADVAATARDALPDDAKLLLVEIGDAGLEEGFAAARRVRLDGDRSPLADALGLAASHVPAGSSGSVTLVSDGHATDESWASATQALSARSIPVHVIPQVSGLPDVGIAAVEPLGDLRVGRTAKVAVRLFGGPADVSVKLVAGDETLSESDVVRVEGEATATLTFEPKEAGFLPVVATLALAAGEDRRAANDRAATTLAIQDPVRVLYLASRTAESGREVGKLVGPGFTLDRFEGDDLPSPERLADYDLAVLDDRPAEKVPTPFQDALVRRVLDGGLGLVVAGGAGSFGPGGYHETPVSTVLPAEFVQKEEKKDPSTALAVIIDTSGSMSGQRIVLAKEVTRLAIRRLLPHDKVGIVEFYGAKRWAAPLQSAANAIAIQRALNRLDAGGGTVILPAIEEAYYGMKNVQTRYKHVLICTDAGVEQGAFEPLLRRMARDGICVSTVLVGPDRHSEFLVELANWGNGRYYNASDRFNLPEVILKQPSTARLPAYRPGVHTVRARGGAGWWGTADNTKVPALAGYVETRARPGAEVLLETVTNGHPVVATWRRGLGRVTAFMSEPAGAGTEPWNDWEGYGPFFARLMARTASDDLMPLRFTIERRDHEVIVRSERRVPEALAPDAVRLGKTPQPLAFRAIAPDTHEARFVVAPDEEVRVEASAATATGTLRGPRTRLVSPANADRVGEFSVAPRARLALPLLADGTGGILGQPSATVGGGTAPKRLRALWPLAFLLALIAYVADVAFRRSSWFVSE